LAKNKFITNNSNGQHNITNRPHFKILNITYSNKYLKVKIKGTIDFSKLFNPKEETAEYPSLAIVSTNASEPTSFNVVFKKENNVMSCYDTEGTDITTKENEDTILTFYSTKEIKMTNETLSTGLENILFFTGIAQILGQVDDKANGRNFASGYGNVTGTSDNIIIGRENESFGQFNAIFGYNNIGNHDTFIAGSNNTVTKPGAGAIGSSNTISNAGDASFACGKGNSITGGCALASGTGNSITSQGAYSFVCGQGNYVRSQFSFICGKTNEIGGRTPNTDNKGCNFIGGTNSKIGKDVDYCMVYGQYLQTNASEQTIFGKYNEEREDALFIIGNGVSGARKNALVLNKNEELEIKSIILFSENGTKFRVKVSNDGTLITEKVVE
jgi:hypothetical protein